MQYFRFTLKSTILCACAVGALSPAMAMNDAAPVMQGNQTMPVQISEPVATIQAPMPVLVAEHTNAAVATGVTISNAMAYATATGQKNGVAFFTLTNNTAENDRIIGITSDISETAEIHATEMVDDIMQMRKLENFELAAGQTVTFEPTGNHVMLMGLRQPLMNVQSFNVQLTFEKAGTINVPVQVQLVATTSGAAETPADTMTASQEIAQVETVPVMPPTEMVSDTAPVMQAPAPVAVDETGMIAPAPEVTAPDAAPAPEDSSGVQGYVSQPKEKKGFVNKIMGMFGK